MAILGEVLENQAANRIAEVENRDSGEPVKGDFDGSVTGYWVALNPDGAGVVSYNNKRYITKPLGFTSISSGRPVLLSHANGVYFSSW